MKILLFITTLIVTSSIAASSASAVSADDLARYLGITSASTRVTLPPESFVAELYSIEDGKVGKRLLEGMPAWSKEPQKGLVIIWGSENGKYRFVFAYGGGVTMGVHTEIPTFNGTLSESFPMTIETGDFVLFGEPNGKVRDATEISSFSRGFLLRIERASKQ